jgi:hypothetical protein
VIDQEQSEARQVADLSGRLFATVDAFHDECDGLTVAVVLNALFTTMILAASHSKNFDAEQFREELMMSLKSLTFVEVPHGHA